MKYFEELKKSMEFIAKYEKSIFIGQAVVDPGTAMSNTLKNIKKSKRIELPVAEEMQMGMTIGLLMSGNVPVSIYPRWNFLLCATNQLVNQIIKERLTIDFDFAFKRHPKKINNEYNNIIIAELKQEKLNRNSFFYKVMRENRLRKTGMSKYCFATSSIFPSLKYNRFKSNFSILEKNNN